MGLYSIVLALCASFIMAIFYTIYSIIERRTFTEGSGMRHLCMFTIIGLLDAAYLYLLFIGAGSNTPYTILVLINAPIVLQILMRSIFETRKFFFLHWLGAFIITLAIVLLFVLA